MSLEKSRSREQELNSEIDRLQQEIRIMQRSSEEGANISHQLSKEVRTVRGQEDHGYTMTNLSSPHTQVRDVEDQISQRKSEVEKLIKEMREANMESLAISPPEESKQFLDGERQFVDYKKRCFRSCDLSRFLSLRPTCSICEALRR